MVRTLSVLFLAALVSTTATASITTVTHSDSFAITMTNWQDSLTFPQFNPSLGELQSINVFLEGSVSGEGAGESRDAQPTTLLLNLQAEVSVSYPLSTGVIATTLPVVSKSFPVSATDGVIDFAGTSGVATGMVSDMDSITSTLNSASDLAIFTGSGTLMLPIMAKGESNASGPGNVISQFSTNAGARVNVSYNYEPVPEPSANLLAIVGFLGLLSLRRRKR